MKKKAHSIIDKFADRGLRSLAVAKQVSYGSLYSQNVVIFVATMSQKLKLFFMINYLLPGSSREEQGESRRTMAICGSLASL